MDSGGDQNHHKLEMPAGFRFYPTDEELVVHYLCRKCAGQTIEVPIMTEIDLYKFNPWDLPGMSLYGEKEWYFFSPRDRKYPNGSRPNRTAGAGYWKATGVDKPVGKPKPLGIKKALVFYAGKSLNGVKTNWIMHEYRLANVDRSPAKRNNSRLDDWVLCRLYNKKGTIEKHYNVDEKTVQFSDSEEQKPQIGTCPYGGMVSPMVEESQSMELQKMSDCLHFSAPESIPKWSYFEKFLNYQLNQTDGFQYHDFASQVQYDDQLSLFQDMIMYIQKPSDCGISN